MENKKGFAKKIVVICLVLILLAAADTFILVKAGVFQWQSLKNEYKEQLESGSAIKIYKDEDGTVVTVLEENNDTAESIDISNEELDNYLESIADDERKALMKDYLLLPSVPQYRIQEISDLTLMERAHYLADMPIDELRAAAQKIRDNVDNSIEIQNEMMSEQ